MRRAGLLYIAAGVLVLTGFFLPAGKWSLWDVVRGVGVVHDHLEKLDFLPLNVALRLVQLAVLMIALLGVNFLMFGVRMVRERVDNADRPHLTLAAILAIAFPAYSLYMDWPARPSVPEILFFAAGAVALAASYLADKRATE